MNYKYIATCCLIVLGFSCTNKEYDHQLTEQPKLYHETVQNLTDVIVHDIFSPPVASRIYAYPSIAAYEIARQLAPTEYASLEGKLTGFKGVPKYEFEKHGEVDLAIASLFAYCEVGKSLIFSENKMELYVKNLSETFANKKIPSKVIRNSEKYGKLVFKSVLEWSSSDQYKQTRSYPQYTVIDEDHLWKPTPPDYMEGIEPSWNKIRPFVLDSASQFRPESPTEFSLEKSSKFYKELMEVYDVGVNMTEEQQAIAQFWDCNPYVSHHSGHVMFATKKITPGGHWIGITGLAARRAQLDFIKTIEIYTLVSISLADGFISCWDEKWRSVLVRPETLINEFIDEDWTPLLQTPPFPEHTSGHSVVSGAAATTLTSYLGDNFAFNDSTELLYGLPVRTYTSFNHAADEAAMSRLYGGIHYMPSIEYGIKQGRSIGKFIIEQLNVEKIPNQK